MAGEFFMLSVEGKGFDAEAYLKGVRFKAYRSGSGFVVNLGDENELSLPEQIEVASAFLREHLSDIKRLREWPGFKRAVLHLSPEIPVPEAVHCVGLYVTAELVLLAAHAGVAMGLAVRPKHGLRVDLQGNPAAAAPGEGTPSGAGTGRVAAASDAEHVGQSASDAARATARTTVKLESDRKLVNLLYALESITESWRHEANEIEVVNEEGMSLAIHTDTGMVFYGKSTQPLGARRWDDNVGHGQIVRLCMLLQAGFYKEIEEYGWRVPCAQEGPGKSNEPNAAAPGEGEGRGTG